MWTKIFFRSILNTFFRFKSSSILILVGLTVAYSTFFVLLVQLDFEKSYNRSFQNYENIYRLEYYDTAVDDFSPYLPKNYLDYLQAELPELTKSCAFSEGEVMRPTL